MKKTLTFLFTFLFFLTLHSQVNDLSSTTQVETRNGFLLDSIVTLEDTSFLNYRKHIFEYNSLGKEITETIYDVDSNLVYKLRTQYESIYNGENQLIEKYENVWDQASQSWKFDTREKFEYISEFRLSSYLKEFWKTTSTPAYWDCEKKRSYEYGADDKLVGQEIENCGNISWLADSMFIFIYDLDGKLTIRNELRWNDFFQEFQEHAQQNYTYDNEGNLEEVTRIFFINNFKKKTYSYDANGNRIFYVVYYWNNILDFWEAAYKHEYDYDANNNLIERRVHTFNDDNDGCTLQYTSFYFYSECSTPIENTNEEDLIKCKFKNPMQAGDELTCENMEGIENYELTIFDITGRLILNEKKSGMLQFQFPTWVETGEYILIINNQEKVFLREKIIVVD